MRLKTQVSITCVLGVLCNQAWADSATETYQLDPVTVLATRTPKDTLDAPASVSVLSDKEINAFVAEHPFKPLTRTEGVWPRAYRGLADYWARPVFRGQRALIMVDGANWYDYGYYYDTAAIPMPDLAKIDIVRGPFSALYGTLAQTAVVNYTTAIPEKQEIKASASCGDWNSRIYSIRFADRPFAANAIGGDMPVLGNALGDRFFYSFSFKSRTSDGYVTTPSYRTLQPVTDRLDPSIPIVTGWDKDIDPQTGKERFLIGDQGDNWYDDYGMFFKSGYDFSSHARLWYSLNISKFKYGWQNGHSLLHDDTGHGVYDGTVYLRDQQTTYALAVTPFLFTSDPRTKKATVHTVHFNYSQPDQVDLIGLFSFNDKKSTTRYLSASRYKVEDNSLAQLDLTGTWHLTSNTCLITVGVQGVQEDVTVTDNNLADRYDSNSILSVRERTSGKNKTLGTFLQIEYSPVDSLTGYLGGRYDHWWGVDADYYANISGTYQTKYPDVDDGRFSPKVSLVYHAAENGTIRASYGKAFTAPSLYYRTASYYWEGGGTISMARPNPDLRPTTNTSWEIGTEWKFLQERLRCKVTYFENNFHDMIINKSTTSILADGTQLIEKQRINAEEAEVNGIELALEGALPHNVKGGLYYSHNWSKYTKTDDPDRLGWEVDETPADMLSLWLGYFGELVDAAVSYRYCDRRYDDQKTSYADTTYRGDDSYHVVDAKITLRPMKHLAVSVGVENLFDEKYYEYYQAPGRFLLGTVTVSY